jgi:uncharacterized protein YbjT (DUF2867 family)
MPRSILITGATGNIGSNLVPSLAGSVTVTALVRDPEKAGRLFETDIDIAEGDFGDAESLARAMAGTDTVVSIVPPSPECVEHVSGIIAAARDAGVRKIVRVSAIKAAEDGRTENTRLHGQCDRLLQESGLVYTILRPNYFMQNIFMSLGTIRTNDCFYAGMGEGRLAMIDVRDVADAIAAAALSDTFDGRAYELSGPESISFNDVAAILSDVADRNIAYLPISPDDVKATLVQMGFGEWMAELLREYSQAYGDDWGDLVTGNVELLTGHRPRSFETFTRDVLVPAGLGRTQDT